MRYLEKVVRLFNGNLQDDVFYHESGHTVLAAIFDDIFKIKSVTVDKHISQVYNAIGGLDGTVTCYDVYDIDKLNLIILAGICTDDINNLNGKISASVYDSSIWTEKFQRHSYSGDIEYFEKNILKIKDYLLSDNGVEYITNSLRTIHQILQDNIIWDNINAVRHKLIKSQNHTLTEIEIKNITKKNKLNVWKEKNLLSILEKRKELFIKK